MKENNEVKLNTATEKNIDIIANAIQIISREMQGTNDIKGYMQKSFAK